MYGFAHKNAEHVWTNVILFALNGAHFEFLHGSPALVALVAVALPAASLAHVFNSPNYVRGFSGVSFAVLVCPPVLLALNWSEMPLRWLRLAVMVPLAIVVMIVQVTADDNVSVASHLGGALAGAAAAIVMGRNLVVEPWEARLSLVAALGIFATAVAAPMVDADLWIYTIALGVPAVCGFIPVAAHRWCRSAAAKVDALPRVTAVGICSQI